MPMRFDQMADAALLQETIRVNPFQYTDSNDAWIEIGISAAEAVGRQEPYKARTCKSRVTQQMAYYLAGNTKMLKKSGTDEEYDEKKRKLQDLVDLKESWEVILAEQKEQRIAKEKELLSKLKKTQQGKVLRDAASKGMVKAGSSKTDVEGELDVEQEEDDGEPKEKKKKITVRQEAATILEILKVKSESAAEAKREALELEKAKLALEDRRLKLQELQFRAANPHMFENF